MTTRAALIGAVALALAAACGGRDFVGPPRYPVAFPKDHGNHADAQTEWWYLQARVTTDTGRELSVFLSAFRHNPRDDRVAGLPVAKLGLEGNVTIFFGCIADLKTGEIVSDQWRPGWTRSLNESGAGFDMSSGSWRATGDNGRITYVMPSKLGTITLTAEQTTKPMPIGALGGAAGAPTTGRHQFAGAAFSYYALPRVRVHGRLESAGKTARLSGDGWLEHQYGFIYSDLYRGWWWSGLMLDDGTDLLVVRVTPLRDGADPVYLGTIRQPGQPARLLGDFELVPLAWWKSPRTGARYPTRLKIAAPAERIDLEVEAIWKHLEWDVQPAPIWEGPVKARGTMAGKPVTAVGFSEFLEKGDRMLRKLYSSGVDQAVSTAMDQSKYPNDPFADNYTPPRAEELGTGAGQMRLLASGGLVLDDGVLSSVQLATEFMTYSFLGLRLSTTGTTFELSDGGTPMWAWQVGPSLHLRPYKRVDFGLYFEAGPGIAREPSTALMPVLSGGLFVDISLSSYWFLQIEGKYSWGIFDSDGTSATYFAPAGFVGLGVQL